MAHLAKMVAAAFIASSLSAFGNGCTVADDDAERFREALPLQEEVALRVPNASGATGTKSGTKTQGLGIATAEKTVSTARYYELTRDITGAVDFTTAIILGGVWAIVHTTPTSHEGKTIVWGPGSGNALEPAVWRFTANEVGDSEYDYVLEGQPKSGGAWLPVLTGHGYGKARPEHRQGWFKFDNDNYKTLDPTRGKDEGSAKVTYDLRRTPATLAVELRPHDEKGWLDVLVTHEEGGGGSVSLKGLVDIDPKKDTKLEDVQVLSRWTPNGSGRADAVMKSGDLPITVDASECWSTSFARVFYRDTVNFEPPIGEADVCTLQATKL